MDSLGPNPFAVLTFIVAPAVLTNASSIMGLQTANRFARAIDRMRTLAAQLDGKENATDHEKQVWLRQMPFAQRRALLLVRALTAFYLSVGSFAGASFGSLLGAICFVAKLGLLGDVAMGAALCCGIAGVGGLLAGSGLLVWETRYTLAILTAEAELVRRPRVAAELNAVIPPPK
jgi:hypothetical protein